MFLSVLQLKYLQDRGQQWELNGKGGRTLDSSSGNLGWTNALDLLNLWDLSICLDSRIGGISMHSLSS